MKDPSQDEAPIEIEIRHEKARSLGKAGEALERACEQAWKQYRAAALGDRAAAFAFRAAYQKARERRHVLLLQREAMGLYVHRDVDACYPMPPEPKELGIE